MSLLWCIGDVGAVNSDFSNEKFGLACWTKTSKMAANTTIRVISPLDGTNYPTWKVQCQMALMKDGLWGIVNETERRPGDGNAAQMTAFNKQWDKALAIIVLSVDPSLLYLIGEPTSPIEVWKKLADQFQKKTWANKLRLRKRCML